MRYRAKPVVIEALRYEGNCEEICEFLGVPHNSDECDPNGPVFVTDNAGDFISVWLGDWAIKGFGDISALPDKWFRARYMVEDEMIEAGARALAGLEPDEAWPTNEDLGGNLTGTRDDEYRAGAREDAAIVLEAVSGE